MIVLVSGIAGALNFSYPARQTVAHYQIPKGSTSHKEILTTGKGIYLARMGNTSVKFVVQ